MRASLAINEEMRSSFTSIDIQQYKKSGKVSMELVVGDRSRGHLFNGADPADVVSFLRGLADKIDESLSLRSREKTDEAYVIYSETKGVCLGEAFGEMYWSKINPGDLPSAPTFDHYTAVQNYIFECTRDGGEAFPKDIRHVSVTSRKGFASIDACVKAGLPAWVGEQTPPAQRMKM